MKSISRMIGIFTIFLFGLIVGSANAATLTLVSSNNGTDTNMVFSNNAIGSSASGVSNGVTISTVTNVKRGATERGTKEKGTPENGGFGIASLNVHLASLEMYNSENYGFTPGVTAKHVVLVNGAKPSSIVTAPLRVEVAGNDKATSEHQTYAMLLVGLGLVGFTVRPRKDEISS